MQIGQLLLQICLAFLINTKVHLSTQSPFVPLKTLISLSKEREKEKEKERERETVRHVDSQTGKQTKRTTILTQVKAKKELSEF